MGYMGPDPSMIRNVRMVDLYRVMLSSCLSGVGTHDACDQALSIAVQSCPEWKYVKGSLHLDHSAAAAPSEDADLDPSQRSRPHGILPLLCSSNTRVDLKTIFFNGCNTAESLSEHRAGVTMLLGQGHTRFLVVGAVIKVDWANGTPATAWMLTTFLMHSSQDQAYRFRHLTAMLRGIGVAYHSEPPLPEADQVVDEPPLDLPGCRPQVSPVYVVFMPMRAACSLTYNCGHMDQDAECEGGSLRNICPACIPPQVVVSRKRKPC